MSKVLPFSERGLRRAIRAALKGCWFLPTAPPSPYRRGLEASGDHCDFVWGGILKANSIRGHTAFPDWKRRGDLLEGPTPQEFGLGD